MGRDKASLPSLEDSDLTMLERTIRLAQAVFTPVCVIGRPQPEDGLLFGDVRFAEDTMPGLGPAGGLATTLRVLSSPSVPESDAVVLLACDLPLLTMGALQWLRAEAEQGIGSHGLAVRNAGQIEPLFTVYTRDVLPFLEDQLSQGRRSLQKLIERGDFRFRDAPKEIAETLMNVNTAEELAFARSQASFPAG
jgi:molybdopterin-guanine dinucleotide biosynthesis protein A